MGSFLSIILAYVVGGITFIPLLILLTFVHAYYTQPIVDPAAKRQHQHEASLEQAEGQPDLSNLPIELQKPDRERDAAAGYFAISREFVPGGVNGKPPERLTPAGEVIAVESPSVYQSMYRSIFERNKTQSPSFEPAGGNVKATRKSRNVFYVALRLGHLMLYDNEDQLEVRHVISLGLYDMDIYGGDEEIPEGELWVRRNCIRLCRKDADNTLHDSKPYYFFSDNCSDKEDFYHALIQSRHRSSTDSIPPVLPLRFDNEHMVKLVQQIHGSEELMQTRWFNALLGRVFLSLYKTSEVHAFIHEKLTKKLTRIQKPSFIEHVKVGKIDMGTAAPLFTNPKLRELTLDGELILETDVKYSGGLGLEIAAAVLIDLGKRFNVRRIDILLAGICKSLEGHLLVKVKPPPCNRIWISFETMPKVALSIEPIVSSRQITYGIILRTIENKIREVIAETLVYPNWDDIPFSRTEGEAVRGGLWDFHGSDYTPANNTSAESEDQKEEKEAKLDQNGASNLQSTPSMIRRRPVGASAEKNKLSKSATDSVAATSGRESPAASSKPKAIRSSSFASTSPPVVSMSPTHANAFREGTPNSLGDAASTMKDLSSRSSSTSSTPPVVEPQALDLSAEVDDSFDAKEGEESDMFDMEMPVDDTPRASNETQNPQRNGSKPSINIEGFGTPQLEDQEKKRMTFVAGAQVATAAARKWGLDLVAKRAAQMAQNDNSDLPSNASVQSLPIGRGQPLPPPGQPLPGPPNAFRKSWTTALGNIGRKRGPPHTPSLTSLSDEGREAALKAAKEAGESTPPLPPRPSTDSVSAGPATPPLMHSRKPSAQHSRKASAKSGRLSMDDRVADDVLVIKAPEMDGEEAATGDKPASSEEAGKADKATGDKETRNGGGDEDEEEEERKKDVEIVADDAMEDNDDTPTQAKTTASSDTLLPTLDDMMAEPELEAAPEAEPETQKEDVKEVAPEVKKDDGKSGEGITETSKSRKLDADSLELLQMQALVH